MRDIATELASWRAAGKRFALASVIGVSGSAPRPLGTALAVDEAGVAVGGVSGGCVEGAVYDACLEVLETGHARVERFGYSDEDAFAVGLTCGGEVDVLVVAVETTDDAYDRVLGALHSGDGIALCRYIDGPETGRAFTVRADADGWGVDRAVVAMLSRGESGRLDVPDGTVAVEAHLPPPRLIVFGAIDFAAALVTMGKFLGYHVTVCDARPVFATEQRFPAADEVVVDWPHRYLESTSIDDRTAVCVLTHDAKFDVPLLERALCLPLGYVGAMGSRRTHQHRRDRLIEVGLTDRELARLRSPIGLDLGGHTSEETALSIAAEMVALGHGATGRLLSETDTPIHRRKAGRQPVPTATT
ncbi:XdhC family protein [Haloglycomyces albus]|uniref:XdhC family protein n=1 Tax=Haloglycomyces albus TaxID=526067 RepID=UPI00046D5359|nr:XdhC/CoxI family protein [Haloglycomyces albus]